MPRKILLGNWKLNKTINEAKSFAVESRPLSKLAIEHNIMIGVAPSYLSLAIVRKTNHDLIVSAQNIYYENKGAFTGEISVEMLQEIDVTWSLVGHSERRLYFAEDNISCNKKIQQLVDNNMTPVYCVGETLDEFELGQTKAIVDEQIRIGLANITPLQASKVVIAYEPVWSIGTGKNASAEIAEDTCAYIRELLSEMFDEETSKQISILYGGSVKPDNIKQYMTKKNIDGALVGGASLDIESFKQLLINIID
jgi:triosephosphate isomerase (TIM)